MNRLAPVVFLVGIMAQSCTAGQPQAPTGMPDVGIPAEGMNSEVRVITPDGWNTYEINDRVALEVEVIGSEHVIFPSDFGARVFANVDDQWVEVSLLPPARPRQGQFLLSPSHGDPFERGEAIVYPILEESDRPVLIRVFVIGNIYQDGQTTDTRVAAYADVTLRP